MEEINVSGIVVSGEDRGEADRLVRILTPELGVVYAVMRGVKKEKAKLKFAAGPFSFCQYTLMRRGDMYTVKTAMQIESLLGVTETPEKYVCASVMLETAAVAAGGVNAADVFIQLLGGLKTLIYSEEQPELPCLNFVIYLLVHGGYIAGGERQSGECVAPLLGRYIRLFENKFDCRIKSATLL